MKTFLFQRLHHPPFQKKKGRYMRSDFNVEDEFMEDDWEADEESRYNIVIPRSVAKIRLACRVINNIIRYLPLPSRIEKMAHPGF